MGTVTCCGCGEHHQVNEENETYWCQECLYWLDPIFDE